MVIGGLLLSHPLVADKQVSDFTFYGKSETGPLSRTLCAQLQRTSFTPQPTRVTPRNTKQKNPKRRRQLAIFDNDRSNSYRRRIANIGREKRIFANEIELFSSLIFPSFAVCAIIFCLQGLRISSVKTFERAALRVDKSYTISGFSELDKSLPLLA